MNTTVEEVFITQIFKDGLYGIGHNTEKEDYYAQNQRFPELDPFDNHTRSPVQRVTGHHQGCHLLIANDAKWPLQHLTSSECHGCCFGLLSHSTLEACLLCLM